MHSLPQGQPSQEIQAGGGGRVFGLILISAGFLLPWSGLLPLVRSESC
nr:MAG TPA: hypothetical protein [Bacteriophage sp.]